MPLPFLQAFPREIRDLIYAYVLASPSGLLDFQPWSPEVAQSLSFLRTSKQVHRECKDIIWQYNGLSLRRPCELYKVLGALPKTVHRRPISRLSINLELLDWDELEWACEGVLALANNPRSVLQVITLSADKNKPRNRKEFNDAVFLRETGEKVDGRLYQECLTVKTGVRRPDHYEMVVNTGWPQFAPWGKETWLREMLLEAWSPASTVELLAKVHNAFGGELHIDGLVCFKHSKQVVKELRLDPRRAEIEIFPVRSLRKRP